MDNAQGMKKIPYLIALAVIIVIAIVVLRGPHISNALKKYILPQLELATGRNIIAKQIYVNLFPLFIVAESPKVFDESGERIFSASEIKAYIDFTGLVDRNIIIRRLVIKEPALTADRGHLEEIITNVNEFSNGESKASWKVPVLAVELRDGMVHVTDRETRSEAGIAGLRGEILLGGKQRINASARKITMQREGWPELTGNADVNLSVSDGVIHIQSFTVGSLGSLVTGKGEYQREKGILEADIELKASTVKKMFNLERSGDGSIDARGVLTYTAEGLDVDLQVAGNFYLETLMELLEVEEQVEGFVTVEGVIKGPLTGIRGKGSSVLRKGNLFGVAFDSLACGVTYEDGTMSFLDGKSRLYRGSAKASGSIQLPVVDAFTVDVDFSDIDSRPLFALIGWDPGVQPGKVNGYLSSSGEEFDPHGQFAYVRTEEGDDILGRVHGISGSYSLKGSLLTLADLRLNTDRSSLDA
jgi:hypothetical protein